MQKTILLTVFTIMLLALINAELVLKKKGAKFVHIGQQSQYAITITNNSTTPIKDIAIYEKIPAGFEYKGRKTGKFKLKWIIDTFPPGSTKKRSYSVKAIQTGDFSLATEVVSLR
ncbi:hypothetical protein [Candidatus Uabimicrobium sp. HlEnr_7]|uniref:hypothetical protein n=1 Tax=Candidatus Uabimicrobium helgolandensis TaxID=3095367 RepID=UPI0035580530